MKPFSKNRTKCLLKRSLFILSVLLFSCNVNKQDERNIGSVLRSDLIQRVTVAGNITPNRKTLISAPYPGYIRKIFVNIGDAVKGGDPIVTLAQSLKENSEETYPLRAPFSGTVVQVLKTEGEYVDQQSGQGGNTLVRIDDLNHLFVDASVPEIEMGKLKVGQEVIIKASAVLGRSYKGRIKNISLAAKEQKDWDRSRVEFPVVIQILDNDHGLKPGMSVVLDIVTQKKTQILTLRHEFIQKNDNQYFVVTQQGERKEIDVGIQNEEVFEIKKGLTEGEKVRQTDFLSL